MKTKSGNSIHQIGIGTWGFGSTINPDNLGSKYRGVEPVHGGENEAVKAIQYSITKGQNHIDCAELYGGFYTDEIVGMAIESQKREDLFIGDKLWKTSVGAGRVRSTVEQMLSKLKTDYIDLLYIHAPFDDAPWIEAISQIDELIDEGIVLGLGVSNFSVEHMKEAMSLSKHSIMANQMNYNALYKDEVDQEFLDFCDQNNIKLVAYQPTKRQEVIKNETIIKIANSHQVTPAQVALAWLLSKNALPIPKATSMSHIDDNVGAVKVSLSKEALEEIDSL